MKLNDLKPAPGAKRERKRLGRGVGSGRGKTAGRGQKGQKSRSGFSQGAGWEGGRSRLIMRLPKRGFNRKKAPLQVINVGDLNVFDEGAEVDGVELAAKGLIRRADHPVKLLGDGALEVKGLKVAVDAASRVAAAALSAAGGELTLPEGVDIAGTAEEEVAAEHAATEEAAAAAEATDAAPAEEAEAADDAPAESDSADTSEAGDDATDAEDN